MNTHFDLNGSQLKDYGLDLIDVDWLKQLKKETLARLKTQSIPSKKDEEWRYTNIKPLIQKCFELAAKKIGLKPEECLVVEDAVSGVEAAKRAGAMCLGLMTSFTREELAQADWVSNTLADAPEECVEW